MREGGRGANEAGKKEEGDMENQKGRTKSKHDMEERRGIKERKKRQEEGTQHNY